MGRAKIDTDRKLPEKKINATFSKRKGGAVNKAKQLGKLCGCDVALILFHPKGDNVIDVSHGGDVHEIYWKYVNFKLQNPGAQHSQEPAAEHNPQTQVPVNIMNYLSNAKLREQDILAIQNVLHQRQAHEMPPRNVGAYQHVVEQQQASGMPPSATTFFPGMQAPGDVSTLHYPCNATMGSYPNAYNLRFPSNRGELGSRI